MHTNAGAKRVGLRASPSPSGTAIPFVLHKKPPLYTLKLAEVRKAGIRRRRIWLLFVLTTWVLTRARSSPAGDLSAVPAQAGELRDVGHKARRYLAFVVISGTTQCYIKLQHKDQLRLNL